MAFWKGTHQANPKLSSAEGTVKKPVHAVNDKQTWSIAAPSPSYKLAEELERQEKQPKQHKGIPQDVKDSMQQWKEHLLLDQAEKNRKATMVKDGPEAAPDPYALTVSEEGSGYKKPELGDTIRAGYIVTIDDADARIVDSRPDFEYILGQGDRGAGEVKATALEAALCNMRRGERASMTCTLADLFQVEATPVLEYGGEAVAVCEIKLSEIFQTKDCSFVKGTGTIVKEVLTAGMGAWCDNPTDEGFAIVRIEEVHAIGGTRVFPEPNGGPMDLEIVPGDGRLCDALEGALLEMRRHETALVTCSDPTLCIGGSPLLKSCTQCSNGATFRVTLVDYGKGPDVWRFDEEDRLEFAARRKVVANRLFGEGRFHLARERYLKIIELFHHMDKKKFKDRFLGRSKTLEQCREIRKLCRLNAAMCSLKVKDPRTAKQLCDAVLVGDPENTKALYRRAQSFLHCSDYVQACNDLSRVLNIDSSIVDAQQLLQKAKKLRVNSDRKQKVAFKFGCSVDGLNDPRSIKNDYMDTPMDLPGVEGESVSKQFVQKKEN